MTYQNSNNIIALQNILEPITNYLIEQYKPQQLILFGSLAYGSPHADSDIDLLIIKESTEPPLQRRLTVRQLVADPHRRVPFSPLVVTPTELADRLAMGDEFYQEIIQRGRILYVKPGFTTISGMVYQSRDGS